jgi:RND family efflux transporter MFP subunit
MKKIVVLSVAGIVVAVAAALGTLAVTSSTGFAQGAKKADTAAPRPALTVTTTRPQAAELPSVLAANGSLAAWQEASIGAEVSGLRMADVRVNVGDVVRLGQVLAVFARETVEADLAVLRAQVAEAEASLADAKANAERARTLQTSGALSAQQISQYLTGEQTGQARVEAARANVRVQELRLRHTSVVAPDDGVISARSATVGAVVSAGTELFRLVRQGRLEWRAEVTADELGRIKPGQGVRLWPASAGRDAAPVSAKVRMIGPTVDPQTRNALVYVDVPRTTDVVLRAGMFARGEFELGASRGLTVPQESVVVRDGFSYVFKLMPGNRVQQTRVQIGRRVGDRIEVTSGLAAEDTIVATGAGFLADGDLVALAQEPAKAAARGAGTEAARGAVGEAARGAVGEAARGAAGETKR